MPADNSLAKRYREFGDRWEIEQIPAGTRWMAVYLVLHDRFGVSYPTVRHAMAILRERGLIVSILGRWTFVASALPEPLARE